MSRILSSNRTARFLVPHALWERQSHRRTRKLSSHSRNKNIYVALILVTQRDPPSRKKLLAGHLNFKFTSFVALYGGNAATVAGPPYQLANGADKFSGGNCLLYWVY